MLHRAKPTQTEPCMKKPRTKRGQTPENSLTMLVSISQGAFHVGPLTKPSLVEHHPCREAPMQVVPHTLSLLLLRDTALALQNTLHVGSRKTDFYFIFIFSIQLHSMSTILCFYLSHILKLYLTKLSYLIQAQTHPQKPSIGVS